MAVALRSNSTYAPGTATTSHVISTPTGFQAGDLLVVALTNPVAAGITPPSGWTEIADANTTGSPSGYDYYFAWKIAAGTEGSSQTFTAATSGRPAGGMFAFSGVASSSTINTSAVLDQGSTAGTSYTTTSITPSVDNCLIAAFYYGYKGSAGTLSFTPNGSWSESADIPNTANGAALELQVLSQGTAGAVQGTATSSANSFRVSVILAIAPSVASSSIKTIEGLAKASVKTVEGLAIASTKTILGLS